MPAKAVAYEKRDHMAVINLLGPLKNCEEIARLAHELAGVCSEITADDEIRVIVLTGTGENPFSFGCELRGEIPRHLSGPSLGSLSVAEPIARLARPVLAAIDGDAIGQGLELALACDLRIAADTSHFGLTHIREGLIPWDGGTQRLSRLVGRGKAMEMVLTGEMIDAKEAYRIGLVNRVVPQPELMVEVLGMGREMASRGPISLRYAKEAVCKGMDLTLEQGLRLEADLYFLLHTTRDRTEGIEAFRKKRAPRFEGK